MSSRKIIKSVEEISKLSHVNPKTINKFANFYSKYSRYTRGEGNPEHHNVFFLPYNESQGKIYLGHHKKAEEWIPPGGHIEPGETTIETIIREMEEELQYLVKLEQIEPYDLSVKHIGRPEAGCLTHYDIWHLIHISEQHFTYDRKEYYDAKWFTINDALGKIDKSPEFRKVIAKLHSR